MGDANPLAGHRPRAAGQGWRLVRVRSGVVKRPAGHCVVGAFNDGSEFVANIAPLKLPASGGKRSGSLGSTGS